LSQTRVSNITKLTYTTTVHGGLMRCALSYRERIQIYP